MVTAVAGHYLLGLALWPGLPHEALAVFDNYGEAVDAALRIVKGTRHRVFVNKQATNRTYQLVLIPTPTPRTQEPEAALLPSPTGLSPE